MIDENDWQRLARYDAGECSAEEVEELQRWIEADPERQEALAFMRAVDGAAERGRPQWDTAASWMRLAARKSARERRRPLSGQVWSAEPVPAWRRQALRAAAVLLLAASGSWLWLSRHGGGVTAPAPVAMREHATARGERATLHLSDGTRVVLAAASTLRYPETFGRSGRRDIYLEGEAFFEVEHDSKRPFLVHTANAVTEDLGTAFGVKAYDTDTLVRVVVTEGSVELRAARLPRDSGALLVAGQLGELAPGADPVIRSGIDVARYLAWTEGKLIFDDTPLREALPQLGRWYDLDFELADAALGARLLTGTFAGEDTPATLRLLASTLDLRYERHGRTVTFYPNRRTR